MSHHIPMPQRALVNQLTGEQTETRQVLLPMLEYRHVAQYIDHSSRFTGDSDLIVDRSNSGGEDWQLKLRHGDFCQFPSYLPAPATPSGSIHFPRRPPINLRLQDV